MVKNILTVVILFPMIGGIGVFKQSQMTSLPKITRPQKIFFSFIVAALFVASALIAIPTASLSEHQDMSVDSEVELIEPSVLQEASVDEQTSVFSAEQGLVVDTVATELRTGNNIILQNVGGDVDSFEVLSADLEAVTSSLSAFNGLNLNYGRFPDLDVSLQDKISGYLIGRNNAGTYNFKFDDYYLVEFEERDNKRRFGFFTQDSEIPDIRSQASQYLVLYENVLNGELKFCDGYFEGDLAIQCMFDSIQTDAELADYAANVSNTEYRLPWRLNESYRVSQDKNTNFSHDNPYNFYTVDFAMYQGAHLVASRGGVVVSSYDGSNAGGIDAFHCSQWETFTNYVVINHGDGTSTAYLHLELDSLQVEIGDTVEQGDYIARAGSTGCSSGSHLHFAVQQEVDRDYGNTSGAWLRRSVPFAFSDSGVTDADIYGQVYYPNYYVSMNGQYRFSQFDVVKNNVPSLNTRGDSADRNTACGGAAYSATADQKGLVLSGEPVVCNGLVRWPIRWDNGVEGWVAQDDSFTNLLVLNTEQSSLIFEQECDHFSEGQVCVDLFSGVDFPVLADPVVTTVFADYDVAFGDAFIHPALGNDLYSMRLTGKKTLQPGWYTVSAESSAGVVVSLSGLGDDVDTEPVINEWDNQSLSQFTSEPFEVVDEALVDVYHSHISGDQKLNVEFVAVDESVFDDQIELEVDNDHVFVGMNMPVEIQFDGLQIPDISSIQWLIDGVKVSETDDVLDYSSDVPKLSIIEAIVETQMGDRIEGRVELEVVEATYEETHSQHEDVVVKYHEESELLAVQGSYTVYSDCGYTMETEYSMELQGDLLYLDSIDYARDSDLAVMCSSDITLRPINELFDIELSDKQINEITLENVIVF